MFPVRRGRALAIAIACGAVIACGRLPPPVMPPADQAAPGPAGDAARLASPLAPGSLARVGGKLTAHDGRPLTSAAVIMSPIDGDALPGVPSQDVTILPDGTFEFRNVPPGRYEIRARGATLPQGTSLVAAFRVSVLEHDARNIDMVLVPGATVSGRLLTEAVRTPKPPAYASLKVRAPMADGTSFGDATTGDVGPDGSFTIGGLMSGSHVITLEGLPSPWVVKSVWHRGQDVTDAGLEAESGRQFRDVRVTITDVATELSGRVFGTSGAMAGHATVIVLPLAPQFWTRTSRRIGLVRADGAGRYRLRGLPAGEYRLVASHEFDGMVLHRRDLLPRLAAAGAPVTLRDAESRVVDLPLTSSAVLKLTSSR